MAELEHIGKYEVVRLLGQGGFGEVFLVRHPELSVLRAVKLIRAPGLAGGDGSGARLQEAVLQAQLEHERIVQVMDVGVQQGRPFLVMEYLTGGSLAQLLAQGPLELGRALAITRDLAQALAFAHERGVIHRDLKPANVLLNEDGHAKVADFGLARLLSAGGVHETKVAGTVSYLAPEQLGGKALPQSDLWALGCLLYEMISGCPPYDAEGDYYTMKAIAETPPAPLAAPPEVAKLVASLMEKDPGHRPESARLVAETLADLTATPLSAGPSPARAEVTCEADDWFTLGGGPGRTFARLPALSQALKPLWSYPAGSPILGSPAVSRGKILVGDNSGAIHCLDMFSGQALWKYQTRAAAFPSTVAAGTAFLAADADGWLHALTAGQGELIWKSRPGGKVIAPPAYTPAGVFLADVKGRLHCLDTADGKSTANRDMGSPVEGSPLPLGEAIVCVARAGRVTALNPAGQEQLWSVDLPNGVEASPAGFPGRVLVLDHTGLLSCLDENNGATVWQTDLEGLGVAAPATDGDIVVCAVLEGKIAALEAQTGRQLWTYDLDQPISASPVLAGNMIALADRGGDISLLSRDNGRLITTRQLNTPLHATPAVWRDLLIAADLSGTVHALGGS